MYITNKYLLVQHKIDVKNIIINLLAIMGPCIGKDPLVSSIRKVHPSSPRICEHSNVISVNYRKIPNKFK